jgi:hypothetical protein
LIADASVSGARVARELDRIIAWRSRPQIIVAGGGTELTSVAILKWCRDHAFNEQGRARARCRRHFPQLVGIGNARLNFPGGALDGPGIEAPSPAAEASVEQRLQV